MYKKLSDVAQVIAGYAFRGAVLPNDDGDISVFQAKDLIRDTPFMNVSSLTKISNTISEYAGHLKHNDVLLIARGMKSGAFRATTFEADDENVVASSSVHVIRLTDETILPKFLSLYLNSKEGQDVLSEIVSGSYIGALPRKELEKIKIPIPSVEKQQGIIELQGNIKQQNRLLNQHITLNNQLIDGIIHRTNS